ncbi:flavin reductase family protein [Corynebacterium lubricantis]|uniref:flavin reductase family protein n=1 Tax=Corynebacterium lubricantis TaxID=541095 RepID=UPI00037314FF|nr:flavin reductase family protein [Corynebacterium lubricantis]
MSNHTQTLTSTQPAPEATAVRSVFAHIPTPLVVVAADINGTPTGITVGSFVGQSLEPALVSVSIQDTSTTWPQLRCADHIGISVLSEDHAHLVRQFSGPAAERFQGVNLEEDGSALLLAEAGVQLTCRLVDEIRIGDHIQAVLEVVRVVERPGAGPLVYQGRRISHTRAIDL